MDDELAARINSRLSYGDNRSELLRELIRRGLEDMESAEDGEEERAQQSEPVAGPREPDVDDLEQRVREWLADRPPKKSHGKRAVMAAWRELRAAGRMQTGALQDEVFPAVSDHYSSKRTMWNAIDRYLEEVPGTEKTGYGEWGYAGDEATEADL